MCNAWNLNYACYSYALARDRQAACPSALWFWVALAAGGAFVLLRK